MTEQIITFFGMKRTVIAAALITFLSGGATGSFTAQAFGVRPSQMDSVYKDVLDNKALITLNDHRLVTLKEGQDRISEQLRTNDEKLNQIIGSLQRGESF